MIEALLALSFGEIFAFLLKCLAAFALASLTISVPVMIIAVVLKLMGIIYLT